MPDQTDNQIQNKLREAWAQQRRFVHTRGAVRLLIWLLALLLADFFIDWFILRGSAGRGFGVLLLIINLVILGWVLWWEWLRHLKPYNPLITALDVESRHPELSSLLVTYTQLSKPAADQPNVSAELIDAMREQAVTKSRPVNFAEIVDFGQLKNLFLVMGGVVLFFAVISINWREHFGTLMQRLAGVDASYPTKTQVNEVTGDVIVRFGDSAPVSATAGGVIPELGQIHTRPAGDKGAAWTALPMARTEGGKEYRRELEQLTGDLEYYVGLGDDKSETYTISVVRAPRVSESDVTLVYPPYMQREDGTSDQLNLEVPEGTTVKWQLRCEPAITALQVNTAEGEELPVVLTGGGTIASFEKEIKGPIDYSFHWTEGVSGKDFQYDDVQHSVRVIADSLPEIEMQEPSFDIRATVNKSLLLSAKAADDNGLGEAWLVYFVDGSAEIRKPIHDFNGAATGDFELTWKLAEDIPELKPGNQISMHLEVEDRYPAEGAQRRRRSATRQISVVDPARYLQWYRSEIAAQQDEIKRARANEETASTQVKQLREQEDDNK